MNTLLVSLSSFSLLHKTYPSDIPCIFFKICPASKLHERKYFVYLIIHCDIPEPKVGPGEQARNKCFLTESTMELFTLSRTLKHSTLILDKQSPS